MLKLLSNPENIGLHILNYSKKNGYFNVILTVPRPNFLQ